ncbi:hypothetical protein [Planctomicrobium piriforme]|uniref:Uncharacterized protein n=1 Tax=Planctomicrobium piriforme TaxID=1576369 RepID=A0A1I3NNK9_9PLAN|nr:hypothetical protein [Planctomicrobium piriforme]SFJ10835.1 hypothetical protein SAMN05421753_115152 [Planctomicrobium piriforme]
MTSADDNPDAAAPSLRPMTLPALFFTSVASSGLTGGLTNAINGQVSPTYFIRVLGWDNVENVWRAVIAQGVFEGLLFGAFYSVIFVTCVGILTGVRCGYTFAVRHLLKAFVFALICWCLGGLAAIGLASLSPEFYRHAFNGVPDSTSGMLAYAWVGGSIWGLELGGLLSLPIVLVSLRADWKQQSSKCD